ncbi:saccharopine dehydrogenase [Rhodococcus sp. WMMA185]|uniref:DUF5938 domain-containing protein n=1 Tax=Rhodococcus sp. WMMA185 TaxID=679318 RepID=UPI0008783E25|nr:DUF5938 domain-containing protein [Rhodococcus sp. WMMA185]AOW93954.1 saccharopine dehydrogenase [Rhodococcus sp. WMMA185]
MTTKPVVVYGASGYTGRLVCEYLREYNIPFVAAGRDANRIKEALLQVPGVDSIEHDIVEVEHTPAALTELFTGARVVCNMVGPFIKYGPTAVEASLAAGCHYTDTTGEQNWVMHAQENWGAQYQEKGLLLSPGIAHMYTTSEIAANICLEAPGLDSLDIVSMFNGFPTYASTQTIFHTLNSDWYYLSQNQYVEWDRNARFQVSLPGQHDTAIALPWGGMSHPVWFKDDPRVANCRAIGGVTDPSVMENAIATRTMIDEKIKSLPREEQDAALSEIASSVQAGMPPRENPRINKSIDSVHASGPLARAHVVIHGNCNYKQTGLLQAYTAYSLLRQPPRRAGFASACQAFGHRELFNVLRSFGLVLEPVVTVHS